MDSQPLDDGAGDRVGQGPPQIGEECQRGEDAPVVLHEAPYDADWGTGWEGVSAAAVVFLVDGHFVDGEVWSGGDGADELDGDDTRVLEVANEGVEDVSVDGHYVLNNFGRVVGGGGNRI